MRLLSYRNDRAGPTYRCGHGRRHTCGSCLLYWIRLRRGNGGNGKGTQRGVKSSIRGRIGLTTMMTLGDTMSDAGNRISYECSSDGSSKRSKACASYTRRIRARKIYTRGVTKLVTIRMLVMIMMTCASIGDT